MTSISKIPIILIETTSHSSFVKIVVIRLTTKIIKMKKGALWDKN